MNASRGVKRKRGQPKAQPTPEQVLPAKLHHSVQEFKRLAKQAKVNETQIMVKKLRTLRSSGKTEKAVEDLESQLAALKGLNLVHLAAAALIQRLRHNRALCADQIVAEFLSTQLQPSLPPAYHAVTPNSAEGKARNRLTSCKTFSGRASQLITDLHAVIDPSVSRPSNKTTVDDDDEDSEDKAGDGEDFFDQAESSDDDDDGWESGSVHSGDGSSYRRPMSAGSDSGTVSERDPGSTLDADSPAGPKIKSIALESDDDSGSTDSDSGIPFPSSPSQSKVSGPSRGAGTSTFLPSLSVGYIPGTGDSDPEDELEAVEGKNDRKNRRGQRARRAIWEKKYGKGAKHVVKQREDEAEKRRIKEEKRRQREAAPKRPPWAAKRAFEPPKQTDSGYGGRSGRVDGQPLQNKPRREDKGLHPSWEAKKKMKEKQSAAIIPPAGKKIVF